MRITNYRSFMIHALFLSLTMSFIDVNTVAPAMLTESGATTFHLGLLTAIMVGFASFMQLLFATFIMGFKHKKPALLVGIYFRVAALASLGIFLHNLGEPATWKIWLILFLITVFSFSGAWANIAYTDILGSTIEKPLRKKLLTQKQLISSIGLIISSVVVKIVLSYLSYPDSYSLLFLMASLLLLFATSGFWMLKEGEPPERKRQSLADKLGMFAEAIKGDRNVMLYLVLVNTSGVILSTLPFLVVLANQHYGMDGGRTGTFLLFQLSGSLIATILANLFSKGQRYRPLLYFFIFLGAFTPLVALLLIAIPSLYPLAFLLGGATSALYHILTVGILLEISTDENRPIYTGIGGAGALMNILYPMLAGLLLPYLGFPLVFILTSCYMLLGLYAAKHLDCGIVA
ncbi:MFS transporter [Sphaerochaeta halotolerans]|uniref:MFS transporter n=1 Tax=Sphaerochaeta halotolerans TaxID=2293840 RepID=A0A372MII6_9SPIR|nr:MFS transporter [Sphaerochaeta halotolerans]RFU95136.1 MFS transporter [Sphaerochaeta halotolerans]